MATTNFDTFYVSPGLCHAELLERSLVYQEMEI